MDLLVSRKEDYARHDISDEALQSVMENILNQMKEAVQRGESLTSEYVVQLSQQLDTYVLIAQMRKMRCVS
ncbi:Spo0E family sporulation regulatory protein-aspartic acid phosphatase [Paenibacillus elgii]|uniref:Spo0E family sporulation regulatory protein-aspartic acid phosphatase n=1 Tax=Paenibacillus elgii TaxID=189691 RepID=UPI000248D787|nr:Spo0E family sporulation regulatory protein-aspartic acid phosphatase [Paenibacillus elgii]